MFDRIVSGRQGFLVLKDNGYVPHDTILLIETEDRSTKRTGNRSLCSVSICRRELVGIREGYCVVGIDVASVTIEGLPTEIEAKA